MHLIDAPLSHRPSNSSSQVSHGSLAISGGGGELAEHLPSPPSQAAVSRVNKFLSQV